MIRRYKAPDTKEERKILTAMIVNKRFLKEILPIYRENSFRTDFGKTISRWCIDFYKQYEDAPRKNIQDIYKEQKRINLDPDTADMIGDFLIDLSSEYENNDTFNIRYAIDKAESYFRLSALQFHQEDVSAKILSGDIDEAEKAVAEFRRVTKPDTIGIDPIRDEKEIINALSTESHELDQMMELPGDLGRLTGTPERGWLIALMGKPGIGKTWWLWFLTQTGILKGFDAYFASFEMSQKQMSRRILHSLNARPTKRWEGEMLIPVFDCVWNQVGKCNKSKRTCEITLRKSEEEDKPKFEDAPDGYTPCTICRGTKDFEVATWAKKVERKRLDTGSAIAKKRSMEKTILRKAGELKMTEYPSGSITMIELENHLANLEYYENFIPDIITTDYADKIKANDTRRQYRHQLGEVWESHKALAQKRHCLCLSASQTNMSRTKKDIGAGDWAESIEKYNLVDMGLALNQSEQDKVDGLMRVSILKQRHDDYDIQGEVWVLQQLRIGRPYLDSYIVGKRT